MKKTFDLDGILSTTRYNLHSHTQFCDGRGTMDQFARAAADAGLLHYGFTPHSPVPFDTPCNMKADDVPAYLAEVERIRKKYDTVQFYAGMEIDYLGPEWGPAHPYFAGLDLDYSIGSVHFLPAKSDPSRFIDVDGRPERFVQYMHEYFDDDIEYVVEEFYRRSSAMVRAGGFDILGHLDKIGANASYYLPGIERRRRYLDALNALVDDVIASGVCVEINTKSLAQTGRLFPRETVVARLYRAHVPLLVNSDTHYPDLINAGRPYALSLL
ncbi:MAG: histidinol-phosphatase HisJ family protein [Bacteroidales bacterium]|nr:histidinol-phosphatase HisJ family protein [Bacteroidales bacterium]